MINLQLEILFILLTVAAYILGKLVYKKSKVMLLHTIIVATAFIILFFGITGNNIELYEQNTKVIRYVLNLSVVAFGFLLYKNYNFIKSRGLSILLATFLGSLSSIVSVGFISILLKADLQMIITLLPKSITTPIAIGLSEQAGGVVYLTAVVVILSGIFGAVVGPWFLKVVGIRSRVGVGLSMGSAAHGVGTAKALEMGALEGALGGLAIALMGLFTSILIPLLVPVIKLVIG
ncbi:MAG: LrgB family protein [Bacteroidales bacterium]|nr:LrgB family protein [Bacteroidales bacterium]MDD4657393.1 LrgB family protein [Bacteroidales bacterium]